MMLSDFLYHAQHGWYVFQSVYENGWNSGSWLVQGLLIFVSLSFLGTTVGVLFPQQVQSEKQHLWRQVVVNVIVNCSIIFGMASVYWL